MIGIRHVQEDDQVLMVSEQGMLIRMNANEISRIGRATQGVRLIRLAEGDRVVSVAKMVDSDTNGGTEDDSDSEGHGQHEDS